MDEKTKSLSEALSRRLTPKQIRFCREYIKTLGNGPEAVLWSYNCSNRNSARVIAHRLLHKPRVQEYLQWVLPKLGILDPALDAVTDALKAEKPFFQEGKPAQVPNHPVRLHAAEMVFKLVGAFDKIDRSSPEYQYCADLMDEQPLEVCRYMAEHGKYPDSSVHKKLLEEAADPNEKPSETDLKR